MRITADFSSERFRLARILRRVARLLDREAWRLYGLGPRITRMTIHRKGDLRMGTATAGIAVQYQANFFDANNNPITDPAAIAAQVGGIAWSFSDGGATVTPNGATCTVLEPIAGTFTITADARLISGAGDLVATDTLVVAPPGPQITSMTITQVAVPAPAAPASATKSA